jgi:hypothetical protein
MKELPRGFSVLLRPMARLNWARYAEAEGGAPNRKWELGYDIWGLWTFPWHKRLNFGAIWYQNWFNRYISRDGASQPWNSEYAWEVFTGYALLEKPVSLEASLSLTSGRKTYEDGVWRFHFVDRDETEGYFTIRVIY